MVDVDHGADRAVLAPWQMRHGLHGLSAWPQAGSVGVVCISLGLLAAGYGWMDQTTAGLVFVSEACNCAGFIRATWAADMALLILRLVAGWRQTGERRRSWLVAAGGALVICGTITGAFHELKDRVISKRQALRAALPSVCLRSFDGFLAPFIGVCIALPAHPQRIGVPGMSKSTRRP
jgi:hypothetical protein